MPCHRIDDMFTRAERPEQAGFIPLPDSAGDPDIEGNAAQLLQMPELRAGAGHDRAGFPFSDPVADGPTIQAASQRALAHPLSSGRRRSSTLSGNSAAVLRMLHRGPWSAIIIRFRLGFDAFLDAALRPRLTARHVPTWRFRWPICRSDGLPSCKKPRKASAARSDLLLRRPALPAQPALITELARGLHRRYLHTRNHRRPRTACRRT